MLTNWPVSIWSQVFQKRQNKTKFTPLKKVHLKINPVKRNLELNDLGFLCYSTKAWPDFGLYRLTFQSLYHTSLITPSRWEIDETVNFRNFCKFFTDKIATLLGHFGTPFSNGKNETKWQGTWSMLQWPSLVHWGS